MEGTLMIPCYIDAFYPQVGIATLELLESLGYRQLWMSFLISRSTTG
jgi:hypothetical protein